MQPPLWWAAPAAEMGWGMTDQFACRMLRSAQEAETQVVFLTV